MGFRWSIVVATASRESVVLRYLHDDPYLSSWLGSAEDENDGRLAAR